MIEPFPPHIQELVSFIEDQFGTLTDEQAERLLQLTDSIAQTEWNQGWDDLAEDINQITQGSKSTLYGESSPESRIHMVPLDEPTVVFTDVDGTQAFTSINTSEGPVA